MWHAYQSLAKLVLSCMVGDNNKEGCVGRGRDEGRVCLDLDLAYHCLASFVTKQSIVCSPPLLALTNNIIFRAINNARQLFFFFFENKT